MFNPFRLLAACLSVFCFLTATQSASAFVHPGIPLTVADLNTVKSNLNTAPWSAGYASLAGDAHSSTNYTMQGPTTYVNRNNGGNYDNENQWKNDMQAIFNLAVMWQLTGDSNYAQKSHDILLAWANTMTTFGGIEAGLDLGDYATRYAGGADILRGTWPGWTTADTLTVSNFFVNVYIGTSAITLDVTGPANKGSLQLVSTLAVAVFNDDTNLFNHILYLYRTASSCGLANNSLTSGEMGETGRDQGHSYNHLLQMAYMAEIFWKQGVDVYSELDNRLLASGEYYARNNLSPAATYIPYGTTDALYWYNSTNSGGSSAGGVYNSEPTMGNVLRSAYTLRKGLTTPWMILKRAVQGGENGNSFLYLKSADTSTAAPPSAINFPTAATVTTGLLNTDIGGAIPSGSSSYSGSIWTVKGGGTEIWTHGSDSAHFTYKQVAGDCTIIAKVNSVQHTGGTAKAGVMIRDSLSSSAGSRAWIAVTAAQTAEAYMHGWTQCYGGSNWENASRGIPQTNYWVKLERHGNMINLYTSLDGTSWAVECVAQFNNLPSTVYLGLVVCSMNTSVLNTATFSNVSITTGNGGNVTIPPAPYLIYASPGAGQVPLRWLQSFGATNYNVLRSTTNGGPYTLIASVTNASYVDTSVVPNTTYYYVITASNSAGTSTNSPQDSTTTQLVPPAPQGLNAFPGNTKATLIWTASSIATSYNVKRSTTNGSGYVTITNVTGLSVMDAGLVNGTTYYYVVSSLNVSGEGPSSSQVSVTPSASATALFWSGAVNGTWDTTTANWLNNGASSTFANGNAAIFDDSAPANTSVSLSANRSPSALIFNNESKNYMIGGSAIAGTTGLIKQGAASLTLNAANTYTGGTTNSGGTMWLGNGSALGSGTLTLNGGSVVNTGSADITVGNNIVVGGSGGAITLGVAKNFSLTGSLSGAGNLTLGGPNPLSSLNLYLSANTVSGAITIPNNSGNNQTVVRFKTPTTGSATATWSIGGAQDRGTTLDFDGTISFGSLSGSGVIGGNGGSLKTLSVGALGTSTTFSGLIQNVAPFGGAGATVALTKVGSGTLTLTGANSYTAGTLVNAGTLAISTVSAASGNYTVANIATLAVNNVSSGSASANNVSVAGGSTLEFQNVASTTTPLIAAGSVTVNGSCTVKITGTNGLVAGSGYPLLNYTGTLSGSFANLQLQMPYGWRGALANIGKQIILTNLAVIATTSPQLSVSPNGGQLQLNWPSDHIGWRLEAQTNSLSTGLGTNWATVAGSIASNQMAVSIDTLNGAAFFRLVYP